MKWMNCGIREMSRRRDVVGLSVNVGFDGGGFKKKLA